MNDDTGKLPRETYVWEGRQSTLRYLPTNTLGKPLLHTYEEHKVSILYLQNNSLVSCQQTKVSLYYLNTLDKPLLPTNETNFSDIYRN